MRGSFPSPCRREISHTYVFGGGEAAESREQTKVLIFSSHHAHADFVLRHSAIREPLLYNLNPSFLPQSCLEGFSNQYSPVIMLDPPVSLRFNLESCLWCLISSQPVLLRVFSSSGFVALFFFFMCDFYCLPRAVLAAPAPSLFSRVVVGNEAGLSFSTFPHLRIFPRFFNRSKHPSCAIPLFLRYRLSFLRSIVIR